MADKPRDIKRLRLLKECVQSSLPDYTMPGTMALQRPTALESARGTACTAEAYITEIIQTTAPSLECGHASTLNALGSLVIKTEDAAQQTFKEMLNPDNAKHALRKTGFYEAGFSSFFNLCRSWEQLAIIPIRELTFDQLDAGAAPFSHAEYVASAVIPAMRRYFVPGVYPTSVESLAEIDKLAKPDMSLPELPLYAGRNLHLAWCVPVREALLNRDKQTVLALVEAKRCVAIRVRVAPKEQEILSDSLCWTNAVRAQLRSSGESMIEWVVAVVAMPGLKNHLDTVPPPSPPMEQSKALGVLFKNKAMSRPIATLVVNLKDLVKLESFRAAHNRWKQIYPKSANEHTLIFRMVQAYGTLLGTSSTPEGKPQMMAFAFGCVQSALLQGAFEEGELTSECMFGAKGKVGWVHSLWRRKQFLDWFAAAFGLLHSNNCGPAADEMAATLIPAFADGSAFDRRFLRCHGHGRVQPHRTGASFGEVQGGPQNRRGQGGGAAPVRCLDC